MRKKKSHRRLVWLIFIPPLLAVCLCLAFSASPIIEFLNSAAFPDYLWTQRITRELSNKGYSIRDFANVSRSESPPIKAVAIGVNSLIKGRPVEPYELVKDVHYIIVESYANTSPQPQLVNTIMVLVYGNFDDTYVIEVNFEDVRRFRAREISEQEYFKRWILLHPDKMEITPP
jgi:hypothetical protein